VVGGPASGSITRAAAAAPTATAAASAGSSAAGSGAKVPIGFEEDTAYLGGTRQRLARAIMAVPPQVARPRDVDAVRYATVLFLVRARGLRLMSVWPPSFLAGLLYAFD